MSYYRFLFSLILLNVLCASQAAFATGEPRLELIETSQEEFGKTYAIVLHNFNDVLAIELGIQIDPNIVQFADSQLTEGDCPTADFRLVNSADNERGTLSYAVTQYTTPPCNAGIVGTFRIHCRSDLPQDETAPESQQSAVRFETHLIANSRGYPIAHDVNEGVLQCDSGRTHVQTVSITAQPLPLPLYGLFGVLLIIATLILLRRTALYKD